MTIDELTRQTGLADALLEKLERINALWSELPSEDDLTNLANVAGSLAETLKQVKEAFLDDNFPNEDSLESIAKAAGSLAEAMQATIASFSDDGFPTADDLEPTAQAAAAIARNLKEASDAE